MSDWKKKVGLGSDVLPTITSVPGTAMVPVHDAGEAKQISVADLIGAGGEGEAEPISTTVTSATGYNGVVLTVSGGSIQGVRVGNRASISGSVGVIFSTSGTPSNFKSLTFALPGAVSGEVVGMAQSTDGADGAKRSNSSPIRGVVDDGVLSLLIPSDMPNGTGYLRFSGTYVCAG